MKTIGLTVTIKITPTIFHAEKAAAMVLTVSH